MSMVSARDYCPDCDYPLEIVEDRQHVVIKDGDAIVNRCPSCFVELWVIDGSLVVVREVK